MAGSCSQTYPGLLRSRPPRLRIIPGRAFLKEGAAGLRSSPLGFFVPPALGVQGQASSLPVKGFVLKLYHVSDIQGIEIFEPRVVPQEGASPTSSLSGRSRKGCSTIFSFQGIVLELPTTWGQTRRWKMLKT